MPSIYDLLVQTAAGETKTLAEYRGQVMLIVNTAKQVRFHPSVCWA
jgi:glutathione peroxidase